MRRTSLGLGALLGGITSLALLAISFLGEQIANLPFIPFDLFDFLVQNLPGNIITAGIDAMVGLITTLGIGPISAVAKSLEQLQGLLLVVGGGVVFGLVIALLLRRVNWPAHLVGAALGCVGFLVMTGIELKQQTNIAGDPVGSLLWLAILFLGWGALLGAMLAAPALEAQAEATPKEGAMSRRNVLRLVGGALGITLVAGVAGWLIQLQKRSSTPAPTLAEVKQPTAAAGGGTPTAVGAQATTGAATEAATAEPIPTAEATATAEVTVRDQVPPAPGTRPEVTSNENFYRIDINTRVPTVDANTWQLEVSGMFDKPRNLTLADIQAYPSKTQPITLSCISNPVGGDLISTSFWMGVPLKVVMEDLGLQSSAKALNLKGVDGFYESVVQEDMQDDRTLLVYAMNEKPLPAAHGFPLRIYIPNRYGMKQPKWIVSMEAVAERGKGYWVDRGWDLEARPKIVSVIDTIAKDSIQNDQVPIGGIAWAGDRGIQKVELQVDGGQWQEAKLRTPVLGPLTWVQWRYDWPVESGDHSFTVRATDGAGTLQTKDVNPPHPSGATGYDAKSETF